MNPDARLALALSLAMISGAAFANLEGNDWIFHLDDKQHSFHSASLQRGTPLVALDDLVREFKLKLSYDPSQFLVHIDDAKSQHHIEFFTWDRKIRGDGFTSLLSRRPEFKGVRLMVPLDFGDRALRPLLTGKAPIETAVALKAQSSYDFVIDPGHGGNDFGASVSFGKLPVREKDLALRFAKDLRDQLTKRGFSAALTRNDDVYLTLPERTVLANSLKAKLFISIHLNSDPQKKQSGAETFVLSLLRDDSTGRADVARENQMIPEDLSEGIEQTLSDLRAQANFEKSLDWAKSVASGFKKSSIAHGRSIKMGPFYVLYGAEMPALLLEVGYITNEKDRNALMSPSQRTQIVKALSESLASEIKKGIKQP